MYSNAKVIRFKIADILTLSKKSFFKTNYAYRLFGIYRYSKVNKVFKGTEVYLEHARMIGSEMTNRSRQHTLSITRYVVVGHSQVVLANECLLSVVHVESAPGNKEDCPAEQKTFDRRLLRMEQEVACDFRKDGQEQTPHNGPA